MLDDPPNPAGAGDAVVLALAPWVDALGASPGNCTADCGLSGEALIPGAAPADPNPVVTAPPAGAGANDDGGFDELALEEVTPDEPAPQPSAIERLPMNEPPGVEQGVPGRLVRLTVAALKVPVADVLVADVVPLGDMLCETTWAWAAADVASHASSKKPAMRCIQLS
jgi:hypothetical protein